MSELSTGSSRARIQVILAGALVVSVLCATLAVFAVVKLVRGSSSGSGSGLTADATNAKTAVAEGGQLAVDFTSFDYRQLSQDFAATAKHATSGFAKVYLAQSRLIESSITKVKAVSKSQVVSTGLQAFSAAKGTATVIVALNDTTTNVKSPAGTVTYYRMQVQLVHQNGQWLANGVSPQ